MNANHHPMIIIADTNKLIRVIAHQFSVSPLYDYRIVFNPRLEEAEAQIVTGDVPYLGWEAFLPEDFVEGGNSYTPPTLSDEDEELNREWIQANLLPEIAAESLIDDGDGHIKRTTVRYQVEYRF